MNAKRIMVLMVLFGVCSNAAGAAENRLEARQLVLPMNRYVCQNLQGSELANYNEELQGCYDDNPLSAASVECGAGGWQIEGDASYQACVARVSVGINSAISGCLAQAAAVFCPGQRGSALVAHTAADAQPLYWGPASCTVANPTQFGFETRNWIEVQYPAGSPAGGPQIACQVICTMIGIPGHGQLFVDVPASLVHSLNTSFATGDPAGCFNTFSVGSHFTMSGRELADADPFGVFWVVDAATH